MDLTVVKCVMGFSVVVVVVVVVVVENLLIVVVKNLVSLLVVTLIVLCNVSNPKLAILWALEEMKVMGCS